MYYYVDKLGIHNSITKYLHNIVIKVIMYFSKYNLIINYYHIIYVLNII